MQDSNEELDKIFFDLFNEPLPDDFFSKPENDSSESSKLPIGQQIDSLIEKTLENEPKENPPQNAFSNQFPREEMINLELLPVDHEETHRDPARENPPAKRGLNFDETTENLGMPEKRPCTGFSSKTTQTITVWCFFCSYKSERKAAVAVGLCKCHHRIPVCTNHITVRPTTPHTTKKCKGKRIYTFDDICALDIDQASSENFSGKENQSPNYAK